VVTGIVPEYSASKGMMDELVTLAVAASAAILGAGVALGASWHGRRRRNARVDTVLKELDQELRAISERLEQVVARAEAAKSTGSGSLALTLDFDELLERLVAEAAARTGADAVAVRVDGPGGEPVVASFGADDGDALLGAALGPPDGRPFRALTINWTQGPAPNGAAGAYESAVVVPVAEDGAQTGVLVAYARDAGAFQAAHVHALQALADEAAVGLGSARLFAATERHLGTDPATGARNRTGYEAELEREVARARRTGRPLSVLLLQLGNGSGSSPNRALPEVAELLSRLTRATDSLCRPRDHELAVLLPGTRGTGARRFLARVRDEASSSLADVAPLTFSAGLVEWRPDETSESLAERVKTAVRTVETVPGRQAEDEELAADAANDAETEEPGSFLDALGAAVARARREASALTVLVVDLATPALGQVPEAAAERLRDEVGAHLAEIVAGSGASGALSPLRFAALLEATSTDAETAVAAFRESLREGGTALAVGASVAAGVTELVPGDDAGSLLGRAERAVDQARLAGDGTVVVATANGAPESP
jgi:GGDEF domain-containing protein